jgi:autotransporter-associated beta strand protein
VTDFSGGASRISGTAQVVDNAVQVTVNSLGAALTWNNHAGTGIWDLNSSANFLNGAANDVFKQYDAVTFGPSSPAGTITLSGSLIPTSVTVDSSNNYTFSGSGSIGGLATLTKNGSGILTVANANTFTGSTTINSGTLTVTGSLGGSEVTIASGATLNGTGTIGGPVTIEGTVSPGASVGTLALATGPVSLIGTYACDLEGATADRLAVTGNLDLTDASLTLNILSAPTASHYVIATYTGSVIGNFASVPEGYIVDTTEAGKVTLRPTPVAPPAGTITFETDQGYPAAGEVAGINANPNGAAYTGADGWALSGAAGNTFTTGSSGEYLSGQSIGCANSGTFVSGRKGGILRTGAATLTFDAPFVVGGTAVGFMKDSDHDGLFDTGHPSGGVPGSGMSFGIGGSPARFQYRDAGFGAEHSSGLTGTTGHWYRYTIAIGESVGGSRSITWSMRNLTTGADFDFNTATPEIDNWTFTVTDAQFGSAPERSDGVWVRATSASRIDNIRATSAEPPAGTAYDDWMADFPSLVGNDRLPESDPDYDGVENLLEFVLNGSPVKSDPAILPTSTVSGGDLVFAFRRRDDSEGLASQTVQYGDDLTTWTDVVIGATDGSSGGATYTVAENADSPDLITVTIPTGASSKKFVRLLVEEAP